mmetsp:Transcript_120169/g.347246  ORF Transcript_120169/g.347246 Transcript_120169/m.347246 type:complete len:218 (+) Transcript_120169:73-726(+)
MWWSRCRKPGVDAAEVAGLFGEHVPRGCCARCCLENGSADAVPATSSEGVVHLATEENDPMPRTGSCAPTFSSSPAGVVEVQTFVREVALGRRVTLLKEIDEEPFAERAPAIMQLSNDAMTLRVGAPGVDIAVVLTQVSDVYTYAVDGAEPFPAALLESLSAAEQDLLVRLCFEPGQGDARSFCFLETSVLGRVRLLRGLRSLCNRAQRHASDGFAR